jgi:hypothetical protein
MTRLADELLKAALRGTPGMEIAERSFLSTGRDHLNDGDCERLHREQRRR